METKSYVIENKTGKGLYLKKVRLTVHVFGHENGLSTVLGIIFQQMDLK